MSLKYADLAAKGVKVAALSCNALGEHQKWLDDVVAHCENKVTVDFPISKLYPAGTLARQQALNLSSGAESDGFV